MRILHLLYESQGDYFGIGGVGIRAYEIYKRLRYRHDITLLCKKYPGAEDGEKEGLKHIFVGAESRSFAKTLLAYACQAARYVERHGGEYDIIIEDFSPAIPTFLNAVTKRAVILQVQGYTGRLYFRKYNLLYASVLSLMELLRPGFYDNFIFVNSETAKKFLLNREKRTAVISNGVSPDLLGRAPGEGDYVLYLGRLDMYGKGLDILLGAYREFHKSFPDIRLVIAGDGRDRKVFDAEVLKLPEEVRKNIELPGWVSGDKKAEFISNSLFTVFPSRHEVQAIAVLEAMACAKTVVVSDIPEFGFVRNNGAGLSFKTGDALSLAQSMKYLATNDERKEMGQRGREWVKDFTWDKIAEEYERFLNELAEKEEKLIS
ncbi:MAG TPA: glycosyltransferase family 4 protein [Thermodesulfovibrionales bacterium]|nr:glycosyltransferase family 4 protein [Thermodesulfovibrionales bacterium]